MSRWCALKCSGTECGHSVSLDLCWLFGDRVLDTQAVGHRSAVEGGARIGMQPMAQAGRLCTYL